MITVASQIMAKAPQKLGKVSKGKTSFEIQIEPIPMGSKTVYNLLVIKSEKVIGYYRVMDRPTSVSGDTILFDYAEVDGNKIILTGKQMPEHVELDTAQVAFRKDDNRHSTMIGAPKRTLPPVAYTNESVVSKARARLGSHAWDRIEDNFNYGWAFALADYTTGEKPEEIAKARWRKVDLPHDWGVEHLCNPKYPSGSSGGFTKTGLGYYRKVFTLPKEWDDRQVSIYFGGIFMNGEVTLNGHFLGCRPYGFTSYALDLTPFLHTGGKENTILVRVDNSRQRSARWYTGNGINRNVKLVVSDPVHIDTWGTHVRTPQVSASKAAIVVTSTIRNTSLKAQNGEIVHTVLSPQQKQVAKATSSFNVGANGTTTTKQEFAITTPQLWAPGSPHLYALQTTIRVGGKVVDEYATTFGLRTLRFDADKGFFINGRNIKLKGVCIHEDGGGAVGNAVPIGVWERRFKILQEMGCNAVRCAHNPFCDEFYDLADRMGMLVVDEAFDEWKYGKREHGYAEYFDEWAERDLRDMLTRNRNHPSIIMWSIGNEIRDLHHDDGPDTAAFLCRIVKEMDTSRPTTIGLNYYPPKGNGLYDAVDLIGLNFAHWTRDKRKEGETKYEQGRREHGDRFIYGSETTHSFQTRGVYRTKTFRRHTHKQPDLRKTDIFAKWFNDSYNSSYDNAFIEHHNRFSLAYMRDHAWVAGEFRWTGIDYLGESGDFPSRFKSFGIIDMCGYPKDTYYLYQSVWTTRTVLHILPHWSWPGMEGTDIPVWVYANNCDEVELIVNGKSQGKQTFDPAALYASWDVPYKAGELKAISYKNGKQVAEETIKTAGEPAAIELMVDKTVLRPNHTDVAHLQVRILDADGNEVPHADNLVTFKLSGPAKILGVDNGDPLDHAPLKANARKAFNGRCLAIVQSGFNDGEAQIQVTSTGLSSAKATVTITGTPTPIFNKAIEDPSRSYAVPAYESALLTPQFTMANYTEKNPKNRKRKQK